MNLSAIAFGIEAHESTNHKYDGKPYTVHLASAVDIGYQFINLLQPEDRNTAILSIWLHDTIEDCRVTYNDVVKVAGKQIADVVYAVTNEKGKNRGERANDQYYQGIRNNPLAVFVKLCDRIANVDYSISNSSKMFEVYRKENTAFLEKLDAFDLYKPMVSYLQSYFI